MTDSIERRRRRKRPQCPNCGRPGSHFAPPSLREPGFYVCEAVVPLKSVGEEDVIITARKAIMCLLLEAPQSVWADAREKIEAAFATQTARIRELEAKVAKLETTAAIAAAALRIEADENDFLRKELQRLREALKGLAVSTDPNWCWCDYRHNRSNAHDPACLAASAALDSARQATEGKL